MPPAKKKPPASGTPAKNLPPWLQKIEANKAAKPGTPAAKPGTPAAKGMPPAKPGTPAAKAVPAKGAVKPPMKKKKPS
jgi:hypothetical protein